MIILFFVVFVFSGCQLILVKGFLGLNDKADILSEVEQQKLSKKRNIPNSASFFFEDSSYYYELNQWYTEQFNDSLKWVDDIVNYRKLQQAHMDDFQPVQMRVFDPNGKQILQLLNCDVNPFLFLNPFRAAWNVEGALNNFPPKIDSMDFSREQELSYYLPHLKNTFSSMSLDSISKNKDTYYVVIIWNDILRKYSRKLIRTMQRYAKRNSDREIVFIYILNQNALFRIDY